ncbi:MAG: hypothetical protein ACXVCP_06065 [Bdellovibrio sp.]
MKKLQPYFLFIAGLALGFAAGRILTESHSPSEASSTKEQTKIEIKEHEQNENEQITLPQTTAKAQATATEKTCPPEVPCPCLFSDKTLDPPEFAANAPASFATNLEGEVRINWIEKPGAKKYKIFLENKDGKQVQISQTSRTAIYLKDIPLPSGQVEAHYFIRLASVNGKDEVGPKGSSRPLHVKPQASVVAPQIEQIKVED